MRQLEFFLVMFLFCDEILLVADFSSASWPVFLRDDEQSRNIHDLLSFMKSSLHLFSISSLARILEISCSFSFSIFSANSLISLFFSIKYSSCRFLITCTFRQPAIPLKFFFNFYNWLTENLIFISISKFI